jgi:hypothetical protein
MKKLWIAIPVALALASCGGAACDNSTPEGAADCACGYADEYKKAFDAKDEAKMKEVDTKMQAWETEVEANMEAGKYTENDVEAALVAKNCDL